MKYPSNILRSLTPLLFLIFVFAGAAQNGIISSQMVYYDADGASGGPSIQPAEKTPPRVMEEMLQKPDFWVSWLEERIRKEEEDNSLIQPEKSAVENMREEKTYWKKEVDRFIEMEESPASVKMQYDRYYWPHYLEEIMDK